MTDRTLYVHAGGSKTGSTALQNFFEINASRLESLGFAYENRVRINSAYQINSGNGKSLFTKLPSTTTGNEIDSLVLSYFGRCNNAICSSEYFAEFDTHHWKKLFESSMRLDVKLKVIFYVRNVIPYFQSVYDQNIKRHGEWRSFDEWVAGQDWQHAKALQTIAGVLPKPSIQVLHFDLTKTNLIRGFLDILGIDSLFEVNQNDQIRLVNRSLTGEERETLKAINKVLGDTYSKELSDLLIYANPNIQVEPVSFTKTTTDSLLALFNDKVGWVNKTFFNGQTAVSILPIEPEKGTLSQSAEITPTHNNHLEKQIFNWAIEKLKAIQDGPAQRIPQHILNILNNAAQNDLSGFHPELPADFDSLAYLLLNPSVLHGGYDPVQHFIHFGEREGRPYKFLKKPIQP